MDRFIEIPISFVEEQIKYLKSNMDRFIVVQELKITLRKSKFKIQYGQIYSDSMMRNFSRHRDLKSNMDRFIVLADNRLAELSEI